MSSATAGRHREYQVQADLTKHGYPQIMRSAASKGPADLLHAAPHAGALLIQVGKGNKTLGPHDRNRLCDAADACHALPILAQVHAHPGYPTRIIYWLVTRNPPSTWPEWTP